MNYSTESGHLLAVKDRQIRELETILEARGYEGGLHTVNDVVLLEAYDAKSGVTISGHYAIVPGHPTADLGRGDRAFIYTDVLMTLASGLKLTDEQGKRNYHTADWTADDARQFLAKMAIKKAGWLREVSPVNDNGHA